MGRDKEEREIIKSIIDYQNYLKDAYGFDWDNISGVINKLKEEVKEFEEAVLSNNNEKIKEEFGDILITIVNISRFLNLDVIESLKESFFKFKKRVKLMEERAEESGLDLKDMSLDELDRIWEEVKHSI